MARFHGVIGFVETEETAPGVYTEVEVERSYFGDLTRDGRNLEPAEMINDDIRLGNMISVVADGYLYQNFMSIRYVVWNGVKWKVSNVEVKRPRLLLNFGGIYHA